MIYHNLYAKSSKQITSAAIIGVGHFGTAVLAQALLHKRLSVLAIADRDIPAILAAAEKADLPRERLAECRDETEAMDAIRQGKLVATGDPLLLTRLPVDTIVEATGIPEAGAVHALAAIDNGKNVVMVNKETDSCVGPILRRQAEDKGVVYTPVDGDQHGGLIQMVEWARDSGLEIICAGKSRDAEYHYDRSAGIVTVFADGITVHKTTSVQLNPEERILMETASNLEHIAGRIEKRRLALSRLDARGGFDLCELLIAANSTGLRPDNELLHDAILRTPEIPMAYCLKKDGGILDQAGVVDDVTHLHEKGEAGMGGGVFVVVSCKNSYSQMILNTKGCLANAGGTAALIYRPYHLCGVEAPTTLLCAGLLGIATGPLAYRQDYDIVQEALEDLRAGDIMGNDHDPRLLTRMVKASPISGNGPMPAHLLNGRKLLQDAPKGTVITYGMVERPRDSVLWRLRERQDGMSGKCHGAA
jgi:predicted homoserine dehydrogenase-like protein